MLQDLIAMLLEATLATSLAVLLVLAVRRPARRWLGAGAAYAAWLCVPTALVAVLLPRGAEVPLAMPVAWQVLPAAAPAMVAEPAARIDWTGPLGLLWLAGGLATLGMQALQQRRFLRALGPLQPCGDGLYQAGTRAGLPAVVGLWRPRIVLPSGFGQAYTPREQALVLQHERIHIRRGDLFANALAALLRCLFWFNPLLPWAQRRFRHDQELACDARVIARNPGSRRAYGEAMLKTQFDPVPLPLGCHWQATHPLKERIAMLARPVPSPLQWAAAMLAAFALSAAAGLTAWAAQPAQAAASLDLPGSAGRFLLSRQTSYGTEAGTGVLEQYVDAGEPAISIVGAGPGRWKNSVVVTPGAEPGTAFLRMRIERGDPGTVVAEPAILVRFGEAGAVEQRDDAGRVIYSSTFRVTPVDGSDRQAPAQAGSRAIPDAAGGEAGNAAPGIAADRSEAAATVEDRMPPPSYPPEAARQGIGGEVVLVATVAADGSLEDVQVEKSFPAGTFEAAVLDAARKWRYRAATRDGVPARGQVRIPVTFRADPEDRQAVPANAGASPVAAAEGDEYQWLRIPVSALAQNRCDLVRRDEAHPDAPAWCGIRKVAVR